MNPAPIETMEPTPVVFSPPIPVLQTDRLVLREWQSDDPAAMVEFFADEPLARYVGGVGDAGHAWRVAAMMIGHWVLRGYGEWALEDKATGALAGWCGLYEPEGWPELEMGWALLKPFHGQGLATEAARRVRDHAYRDMGRKTLVSYIRPDNYPSKQVAKRLGAIKENSIELRGHSVGVYRHPGPAQI